MTKRQRLRQQHLERHRSRRARRRAHLRAAPAAGGPVPAAEPSGARTRPDWLYVPWIARMLAQLRQEGKR